VEVLGLREVAAGEEVLAQAIADVMQNGEGGTTTS
jgi:hypothetical protein